MEWLRTLVEFAEDNTWEYNDNCSPDKRLTCRGCGVQYPSRRPWPHDGVADAGWLEHKPDCELVAALTQAKDQLERGGA